MNYAQLRQLDFDHLWHPFTPHQEWLRHGQPLIIKHGQGFELIDVNEKRYIDGVSSIWCNVHGHAVPEIDQAVAEQLTKISHATMLGMSSEAILKATESLLQISPQHLSRIFFADSGTAAVEAGLRMALEWCQKHPEKRMHQRIKYASLDGGYHGDTLGSVGVGYVEEFHRFLASALIPSLKVSPPHIFRFYQGLAEDEAEKASLRELRKLFETNASELAAFIIEPFVQGPAGIWIHSASYLKEVEKLCREFEIFLIADEVAVGFGKTGQIFASNLAHIKPDIITLGKGLSAGYLPISAALCTEEIFAGFSGELSERKTFYYGQTFAGNCLAAAAVAANIQLLVQANVLELLPARIEYFHQLIEQQIAPLLCVDEVRKMGVMVGIELTAKPGEHCSFPIEQQAARRVTYRAAELGAFIRPVGNVVTLCPAIAMDEKSLARLVEITATALNETLCS